jgi:cholesterol oxidase
VRSPDRVEATVDFAVIGSGFGGSVSAMRLAEKGYQVVVLERGRRFEDEELPRTNWQIWDYLWMPAVRCYGILQLSLLQGALVLHGSGVGGGSLVYAGVLVEPEPDFFSSPAWAHLADWASELRPHYATARRMLGIQENPQLGPADQALRAVAEQLGRADSFRPTQVGIYLGEPGVEIPDPYFQGEGPARSGCTFCGGCMVGCRHNAKNTLPKNYLYFASKRGVRILAQAQVEAIWPLHGEQVDGARYAVEWGHAGGWANGGRRVLRARNVIVAAGTLGTLKLLLRCRDQLRSLPRLSPRLGELVRTNSESFVGAWRRRPGVDHSQGLAISSIIRADETTQVETVRFPKGSSLLYWLLATPFYDSAGGLLRRAVGLLGAILRRPLDFLHSKLAPGLAQRTVALMIMQTKDNRMRLRLGRSPWTMLRLGLVGEHDERHRIPVNTPLGHRILREFSERAGGAPSLSLSESLLGIPMTAHPLGGCTFGREDAEGVIDLGFQAHHYPGLYVVDGSVVPANPGINPSLTITALAELAMSRIPPKLDLEQ